MRTVLVLGLALSSAPALAQPAPGGAKVAPEYTQRSMTLSQGQLRADFNPIDWGLLFSSVGARDIQGLRIGRVDGFDDTILTLGLGAGYGITDDIEAGVLLLPLVLAPDGDFGDIELYGRYVFLRGDIEIGGQLAVAIPTNTSFGVGLGLPVLMKLGAIRLDTGVEIDLVFSDPDNQVNLEIPVAASFTIADGFFGGVRSGLVLPDFDDLAIPLHAFFGYTLLGGQAPLADITATFGWPAFLWSGPGDAVQAGTFEIIAGARFFFSVAQ